MPKDEDGNINLFFKAYTLYFDLVFLINVFFHKKLLDPFPLAYFVKIFL